MGKLDSKNKFNGGVEIEEDYGVNLYSTFYRQYDPQIGRFSGVDMLAESSIGLNPYQFGNNNPVSYNDPTGAMVDNNNSRGSLTVQNRLRTTPGWVSDSWDAYFGDPYGYNDLNRGGGGGNGGGFNGMFTGSSAQEVFKDIQNAYTHPDNNGYSFIDFSTDKDGNIFDEYSDYSEMDNDGNGYKDQTIFFHQHIISYLPVENNGLLGSYRIDGYAQITHQTLANGKAVIWYLTIGATGTTVAQLNGDVEWYGTAQLVVGGDITSIRYLKNENINPAELNNTLGSYVGTAAFSLPITNESVQAILNVTYTFQNEQGLGGSPKPTITHYINISH